MHQQPMHLRDDSKWLDGISTLMGQDVVYHIRLVGVSVSNLVTTKLGQLSNGKGPVNYVH